MYTREHCPLDSASMKSTGAAEVLLWAGHHWQGGAAKARQGKAGMAHSGLLLQHASNPSKLWASMLLHLGKVMLLNKACSELYRSCGTCGRLAAHLGGWGRAWRWRLLHDFLYHSLGRRRRAGAWAVALWRALDNFDLPLETALARVSRSLPAVVPHSRTCTQEQHDGPAQPALKARLYRFSNVCLGCGIRMVGLRAAK